MPDFSLLFRSALHISLCAVLALPAPMAFAAEAASPSDAAKKGEEELRKLFEGAERTYSHLGETVGNTAYNSSWFAPALATNLVAIATIYYVRHSTLKLATSARTADILKEVSREAAFQRELLNPNSTFFANRASLEIERDRLAAELKTATSAKKVDKVAVKKINDLIQSNAKEIRQLSDSFDELGNIQMQRKEAYKLLREKLIDAKKAYVKEFVGRMSKEEQKLFWAQQKARGIRFTSQISDKAVNGAATFEELTAALDKLHEIDRIEHQVLSRAAPLAEHRLGLKPGSIAIPEHPDRLLTRAANTSNMMAHPRLVQREHLALQDDIARATLKATRNADLATTGLPWFKFQNPFRAEPTKLRNISKLVLRKSMPFVLLTGTITATTLYYRAQYDLKHAELEGSRLTNALLQSESDALLKEVFLYQGAGTLMVQFQWKHMIEKYGKRGFDFECPVNVDDEVDVTLLTTAFQNAQHTLLERRENPREGTRYKPAFYKEFWTSVFALAEERQPNLKVLPEKVADKATDELISREELISELSADSEIAMYEATGQLDEYHTFLEILQKLKPKEREPVLKGMKNEQMRAILEARLATLDKYKKDSTVEDPDPEK